MSRKMLALFVTLTFCSLYSVAQAQDDFRIARLSYLQGHVSFQHTDEIDWTAASINLPLQPGDRIYTGDDGRTEIEFDDGSILRLAEKTDVEILSMKDQLIQLRVSLGLCSLINRSDVQFEIDTPAAAFSTTEKGSYRFDIAESGASDAIIRKGELEVVNNRFSRRVQAGEVMHVPAADNESEILSPYGQRDAWDDWNDRRNAERTVGESSRYLPDSVSMGVAPLDAYGRWMNMTGYGPAWMPTVNVGWSPYSLGHWVYRPLWGWTWVSDEDWGWLPYHYGRWCYADMGWFWLPDPSFGFNFWSPGLVQFYEGPGWVSWIPLGPGDYYDINNLYFNNRIRANLFYLNELRLMQRRGPGDLVNRNVSGAFRVVRTDQFVNGNQGTRVEPVRGVQDPSRSGRIVTGGLDVRPTVRSYSPAPDRPVVRPTVKPRPVVVRTEPVNPARNDRFVRITNPQVVRPAVSRPGTGTAGPPARDMRTSPNTNARTTGVVPGRDASSSRSVQTPQYRPGAQPAGSQQPVPRAQQPPAGAAGAPMGGTRNVQVSPPRSAPPSMPPSTGSSRFPSSPSPGGSVSAPPSAPPASSAARPSAPAAPPASSAPPASGPVKK